MALGVCLHTLHYSKAQNTDSQQLNTQSVDSKLQAASNAVIQAFTTVLDAEKAGANVIDLISKLNGASELLAQANIAYRTGDLNTAANNADALLPITQEVLIAAQNAKQSASINGQNAFWSTLVLTLVGIFCFVLALFFFWCRFKKKYITNLLDTKPEVNINEA